MTTRCQALHFGELSAMSFPTVVFFFTPPSIAARAEPVSFGSRNATGNRGTGSTIFREFFARVTVVLLSMSSATLILLRYRRRDYASPRRIGRRN